VTQPLPRTSLPASPFSSEIQALRALAVLLVVVFHLWPNRLTGGFVGVDVFFVISGYLITGHLLREASRPGGMSLRSFWARRVRRLLPAAVLVLAVCLVATVLFLPSRLWEETARQVGASAVGIENWVLAANSVDYFGAGNKPTMVQHFWSLSLEEQFYAAWPVLLFALFLLLRRRSVTVRIRFSAAVMAAVFATSLTWSVIGSTSDPSAAYFSTFTHAWELAGGGLLSLLAPWLARSRWSDMQRARAITTVVGLFAILVAAVFFTGHLAFPGWIALLPVLGTLAVIAAGRSESRIQRVLMLGSRPVQLVGGASYSTYLWHWPLIVVLPFVLGVPLGTVAKLLILVGSVVLGWLSKRMVEDPARRSRPLNYRLWVTYAVAALAVGVVSIGSVTVVSVATAQGTATQLEAKNTIEKALGGDNSCFGAAAMEARVKCPDSHRVDPSFGPDFAAADWGSLAGVTKDGNLPPSVPCTDFSGNASHFEDCKIGDDPKASTVAIVGDSHGLALLGPLVAIAQREGWNVRVLLHNSCTPSEPMPFHDPAARAECNSWRSLVTARITRDHSIDTVVATGYTRSDPLPDYAGTKPTLEAGYAKLWSTWAKSGKRVHVIYDVPETSGQSVPDCVAAAASSANDPCSVPRAKGLSYDPLPSSVLLAHSAAVTGIDLSQQFCDARACHAVIGGLIAYRDFHHLSGTFALTLIPAIERGLGLAPA
jgi:peptidoglycan/LPS O-acetylase OafA/YrhL